jgi:DNA-binding protein YbaB
MGMMKQLQKMQQDMLAAQQALEDRDGRGLGGRRRNPHRHHRSSAGAVVQVNPALLDTSDPEWVNDLQDLLVVAVNDAIIQSQTMDGAADGVDHRRAGRYAGPGRAARLKLTQARRLGCFRQGSVERRDHVESHTRARHPAD